MSAKARKVHADESPTHAQVREGVDALRLSARAPPSKRALTGSPDTTSDADEDGGDETEDEDMDMLTTETDAENEAEDADGSSGQRKRKRERSETEMTRMEVEDDALVDAQEHEQEGGSEMGIIEEIYCENFMCHRKMRVQLSPHINFITGENGSGKSAVIAAIQICLGASARSTHRGKSIKNLIRHGHEGNALVRITLRNDAKKGSDAFRPQEYGKKIIVERLIRRDGSAEYRLKNEDMRIVSKMKADLDAMMDHLNIQTENPCAILDQESAKLFLKGNPLDKYKFFLQSTDLYKMRNTYAKIAEETQTISSSVLRREETKIETLRVAMKEATERWQEAQSIGQLEEEFAQLKKKFAWSFVHEKEVEAQGVKRKIQAKQRDAEIAEEEFEKVAGMVQALENKQRQKNDAMEQINARVKEVQKRKEVAKNRIREARRPLTEYRAEIKQINQQRERARQRIQRLRHDIQSKRRTHEAMVRNRMQKNGAMREQIEQQREHLSQLERQLDDANREAPVPPMAIDEAERQHDGCRQQLRDAEAEVARIERRISELSAQKRDSLAVYGHMIPRLQQLIHQNLSRFTEPPIGPLGMFVKLPQQHMNLALAVEVALKGSLQSYLVVNGHDKALLDNLKRQIKCPGNQATIIIAKRTGRRYNNLRVAEGSLAEHAICNILDVSDDDVFNALIDVCSTESKLIYEERTAAERSVLSGNSGNFRMARYVSEVYVPNGDKFVVRGGNLAYIAHKGNRRSSIICHDVDGEINDMEQRRQFIRGNCETMRRDESRLRQERDNLMRQMRSHTDRINQLNREVNQRRVELRNMEDDVAEDAQQLTLDTSVLEDEIVDVEAELKTFDQRETELNENLSKCNPDLEGLLAEANTLGEEEEEIARGISELQEDVNDLYKHLSETKTQKLRLEGEVTSTKRLLSELESRLETIHEECDELTAKAKQHCQSDQRVEVKKNHEYYAKRLTDIKQKIERERDRFDGMNLNDLFVDKEEKRIKFETKKHTFDRFSSNLEHVQMMLDERQRVWQILRKQISHRTSMEFNNLMRLNNFAGRLRFGHEDQRLDIAVLHNEEGLSRASQVTDMKELSGGERSYTQVSLLLALGESIECPFRVMDEFDVFMDSVNRDMTIQLLVDAAKKNGRKQFIFVTPNDLSTLRRDPKVKIQKMEAPRDRMNADHA